MIVEVKDALGHSATKSINMKIIDAGGSGGEPKLISYLGKDSSGNYYRYSVTEFNNSYLAYQFKPSLPAAKMYQQFLNSKCKIVGWVGRSGKRLHGLCCDRKCQFEGPDDGAAL